MDDALLVRVLDREAGLDEEREPVLVLEMVLVAVIRDAHAAHELHHEERPSGGGGAGVEHARDVRVIHHRQRLPLGLEAGDDALRVHAQLDDLERDAAPDGFLLLGHVNHAAATLADHLKQFVTADAIARTFRDGGELCAVGSDSAERPGAAGSGGRGRFQKAAHRILLAQEIVDALAQFPIVSTRGVEVADAFRRRLVQATEKDLSLAGTGG